MIIALIALTISGCSERSYDAQTMTAIQPCLSMGFPVGQCVAAFQQAGSPYGGSNNSWLGTVAAFAVGAAASHWWNRNQTYTYRPDIMSRPDYYSSNYSTPQRQQFVTPNVRGIPQTPVASTPAPLFQPTKIAPNLAKPLAQQPGTTVRLPDYKPTPAVPVFKPIQVQAPSVSTPVKVPAFKPIQVQQPKSAFTAPRSTFRPARPSKR